MYSVKDVGTYLITKILLSQFCTSALFTTKGPLNRNIAQMLVLSVCSGSARLTSFETNFISKEPSRARPEYTNIHPPPPN